jgi:Aldehyde dehydrogenase family
MPFGGYKASGVGRDKGEEALHNFTQTKVRVWAVTLGNTRGLCSSHSVAGLLPPVTGSVISHRDC